MRLNRSNIPLLALLVFAAFPEASASAHLKHTGPVTLDSAYIVFHTKDDDKDNDSAESITVSAGEWRVGTTDHSGSGTRWPDQQDTAKIYLDNVDKSIEPSDCEKIHVDINHSTKGNDNFKFAYTVCLNFSDNSTYTYEFVEKANLTKDSGHGAWDITRQKQ